MSSDLVRAEKDGVYINTFYGGPERGRCVQITVVGESGSVVGEARGAAYVQMTWHRYRALVRLMARSVQQ